MRQSSAVPAADARVLVLGPVGLQVAGRWAAAPSEVARAVLAGLAVTNGPVADDSLYELVWGARTPRPGSGVVAVAVHRLRGWLREQTNGTVSVARVQRGYRLDAGAQGTDLAVFRDLMMAGADGAVQRLATLERALGMWRGRPLADVPVQCRDEAVVARLERERIEAMRACATAALAAGAPGRAVEVLEDLADTDPLDEASQAMLVEALAAAGRQAAALAVYQRVRARLADELGVDPGPQLHAAYLRVLRQQVPSTAEVGLGATASTVPPRVAVTAEPCLLPPDIADFTGRTDEVRQVLDTLLARAGPADRPATLVVALIAGRAGVGKTALAVRAAHQLRGAFPHGQLFVDLGGAQAQRASPAEVLARFLRALGVDGALIPDGLSERQELYRARLADRRVLVVLDNATDEAQVEPLLPGGPSCAALITSRGRLTALAGARILDLEVLDPEPATKLLAAIAGPHRVAAEPRAAGELVALCGRLPLAVRVVGARLAARRHWSLTQLVNRLADERHRLDELTHHHLEVRASLALSYQGVDPQARRLLRLLGLLHAPDVAAWVAAPLLEVRAIEGEEAIERLVDAQLLDVAGRDPTGQLRYRLHDLIRLYARERAHHEETSADRTEALRRALGAWLDLVRRGGSQIQGSPGIFLHGSAAVWPLDSELVERLLADPLAWYDSERLSVIAAVRQAAEAGLDELCWDLACHADILMFARSHFDDSRDALHTALAATCESGNRRGQATMLDQLAVLDLERQQFEQARSRLAQALSLFKEIGDDYAYAFSLMKLGAIDRLQGHYDHALHRYHQVLVTMRQAGERALEALTLRFIGSVHLDRAAPEHARPYLEQAVATALTAGSNLVYLQSRISLGDLYLSLEQLDHAEQAFTEAVEALPRLGQLTIQALALHGLGQVRLQQGRTQQAATLLQHALSTAHSIGHRLIRARALITLGELHHTQHNLQQAVACLTEAITFCRDIGIPRYLAEALQVYGEIANTAGQDSVAQAAWAEALTIYTNIGSGQAHQLAARLHAPPAVRIWGRQS
ncbi:MAG TPA: BTAD domain-containing putative transcriptional regulator [Kribbellaceae bacterium]|nr:BTAD domain-containing putative transcriptional regulator [Kribbellaceae bacterium]